ncbi:MAG TPA: ABC transporter permease [Pseudonocardia sp.]|uniref:ABC transporter permease n=1 Tax=Pseudonocardia sp. TaxID=60912 RepID=UPI002C023517|nr:ABC transporter permease [Pseudonocardia sp.]HTF54333.1 ABC transporter permease [Pseudonocardia sp.]
MAVLDELTSAGGAGRGGAVAVAEPGTAADRRRTRPGLLVAPALILLLAFFVYPVLTMVWRSLTDPTPGLGNFVWFFTEPANLRVLARTFTTSLWVTVIALLLSYPYAYAMTAVGRRGKAVLTLLVLVPFWTSLMVRTFAWQVLLQDTGVVNRVLGSVGLGPLALIRTETGVIIGMTQVLMPFLVLPLYAVMSGIDLRLVRAARSLGARPLIAFTRVYLPLSMPGVVAGTLMVFILSLGFYITPALLGSPTDALISQQIFTQVSGLLRWGRGGAMGVVLLVATLVLVGLVALALRRTTPGQRAGGAP